MFHLCTECGCSHTDKVILEALLSHQRTEAVVQKDDQRRRATSQACQQRHLLWGLSLCRSQCWGLSSSSHCKRGSWGHCAMPRQLTSRRLQPCSMRAGVPLRCSSLRLPAVQAVALPSTNAGLPGSARRWGALQAATLTQSLEQALLAQPALGSSCRAHWPLSRCALGPIIS